MDKAILILGEGGHSRVLQDLAKQLDVKILHVFENDKDYDENIHVAIPIIIAIGNNAIRAKIVAKIKHPFAQLIHPSAQIASDVEIGEGTVVLANAVIQTGTIIGKHNIINANVVIDHDVKMGDYVTIYPNAYIGGGAQISDLNTINACQAVPRLSVI